MSDKAPFLFPIKAAYVKLILAGDKRFEFRKSMPGGADRSKFTMGDTALIYESRGRGRVVASFRVGSLVFAMSPGRLWQTVETMDPGSSGIGRKALAEYLDKGTGVAFGIEDVRPLDIALPASMRPPQSWVRWRGDRVDR